MEPICDFFMEYDEKRFGILYLKNFLICLLFSHCDFFVQFDTYTMEWMNAYSIPQKVDFWGQTLILQKERWYNACYGCCPFFFQVKSGFMQQWTCEVLFWKIEIAKQFLVESLVGLTKKLKTCPFGCNGRTYKYTTNCETILDNFWYHVF